MSPKDADKMDTVFGQICLGTQCLPRTVCSSRSSLVTLLVILAERHLQVIQFFSHVGTKPPLPGYYQYFWEVNVSCSRTQQGDLSEDRTPDLSLRSPTLYHKAIGSPVSKVKIRLEPKLCLSMLFLNEPHHEKTNVLFPDLVRHKPTCTATEVG